MKRLYLRLYAGIVLVLLAFWLLVGAAAWIGSGLADRDDPGGPPSLRAGMGHLLTLALPPPAAGAPAARAALEGLSERFRLDLALYDPARRLVAAAAGAGGPPLPPPRHRHRQRRGGGGGWMPGAGGRRAAFAVPLDDGRWLVAARTGGAQGWGGARLPRWLRHWVAPLALLAAAIALGAWPLARGLTRRLERLQARVDELGEGSLSARVEVEGKDEVARLARSFNRAADRIERLVEAQRDMLAGASHELRTPLTRIRMALELLDGDPAHRRSIERDIAELDELIEELLTAARLDAPEALAAPEPVDLLALLAEEGARVGAEVGGEPVAVQGVERLLRRLVRNLLENARRHGGGSVVAAEARRAESGEAVVRVTNGGRPIPAHLRERIFEPFFRIGTGTAGGAGLGLALVRRIAEHHGGRARLAASGPEGTVFEVALPIGRAASPRGAEIPPGAVAAEGDVG